MLQLSHAIVSTFLTVPGIQAAMVTGSVARGESDRYSDIDMALYYNTDLPSDDVLEARRVQNGGSERIWTLGDRNDGSIAEAYDIRGVQCQLIHSTIEAQNNTIAGVFEQKDTGTPAHKAMSGVLDCIPLYGDEIIAQWKSRVEQYPDDLAKAVVEKHLAFFPVWYLQEYLAPRDASLWIAQSLLEAAQNILGVLAGLNRKYYSTFQFKRMNKFTSGLSIKPDALCERIEMLLQSELSVSAVVLESLVRDTVELVEQHMPDINTTKVRMRLGARHKGWEIV